MAKIFRYFILLMLVFDMHSANAGQGPWVKCKKILRKTSNPYRMALYMSEKDRSGLDNRVIRSFEPLNILNTVFRSWDPEADPKTIIGQVRKLDARIQAFRIEAGLRATMEAFDGNKYQVLKAAEKEASKLRFVTGEYTDSQDVVAYIEAIKQNAKKLGRPVRFSKKFQKLAQGKATKGQKDYIDFLYDEGWIGKKPRSLQLVEGAASIVATLSPTTDLQIIRDSMIQYIKGTQETDFDMDNLEEGIHPLRRHLRWMAVMIQALNMFELHDSDMQVQKNTSPDDDDLSLSSYIPHPEKPFPGGLLDPSTQKYAALARRGVGESVLLDRNLYEYLTYVISELGKCKETGQRIEWFAELYLKSGEAKNEKEALQKAEKLASFHPGHIANYKDRAQDLYEALKDSGFFDELVREVIYGINQRLAQQAPSGPK